jgi:hypothetical protein
MQPLTAGQRERLRKRLPNQLMDESIAGLAAFRFRLHQMCALSFIYGI